MRRQGRGIVCFFAFCSLSLSQGCASTNGPALVISIRTSAGSPVPFTATRAPHLEIINNQLNLALSSKEGMIFELTGIPATNAVAARAYGGNEFRALLLHSGFQEEAAADDAFENASKLQIRTSKGEPARFLYTGKLQAGREVLQVRFECSAQLPANRQFIAPQIQHPGPKSTEH